MYRFEIKLLGNELGVPTLRIQLGLALSSCGQSEFLANSSSERNHTPICAILIWMLNSKFDLFERRILLFRIKRGVPDAPLTQFALLRFSFQVQPSDTLAT